MATTDDFDVDPVFNDQEEVMPLPIGGGETMASGDTLDQDAPTQRAASRAAPGRSSGRCRGSFLENKLRWSASR